ncbi:MAG: chemotaxis protein CheW [Elusimicrobia bacterium]|nr:chemotaxis protein CheW [Elusimicrobiota bacterium]
MGSGSLEKAVVAPVPGTPPTVAGLLNLQGAIVTVLDIRSRLGLAPKPSAESGALLCWTTATNPWG